MKHILNILFSAIYYVLSFIWKFRYNPFRVLSLITDRILSKPDLSQIRSILLIRLDGIGDIVLFTPVLRSFREQFPDSEISILVSPVGKKLLANCPYVDHIISYDYFSKHGTECSWQLFQRISFFRMMRKKTYDLCVDFRTDGRTTDICYLVSAHYRVGYDVHGKGCFLNTKVYARQQKHMSQKSLDVCRAMEISLSDEQPFWWEYAPAEQYAEQHMKKYDAGDRSIIIIHAGAGEDFKQWPAEKFISLCNTIMTHYQVSIFFIGGPSDREKTAYIRSHIAAQTYDLVDQCSFDELYSLFKRAALFIGNDSGPMHLAAVSGVDLVVIQAYTTDPVWWAPASEKAVVLRPDGNSADDPAGFCQISSEMVYNECKKVLEKNK